MINIDDLLTRGQIATALLIIAFVLVFVTFGRLPQKSPQEK